MSHHGWRTLLAVWCTILIAAAAPAQNFILDAIHPGRSTDADLRTRLGDPVQGETAGDLKVERFEPKDKLLKEITCWFDAGGVLQWARVLPLNRIGPEDAALLFASRGASEVTQGNAFSETGEADGKTWLHRASGIHWYVRGDVVEALWFTLPNADPAQIRVQLKTPFRASIAAPKATPQASSMAPPAQTLPAMPSQTKPQSLPAAPVAANPADALAEIRPAVPGASSASFRGIILGRSTRVDVDALLGAPRQTGRSAEGKTVTTHDGNKVGLREVVVRYGVGDVVDAMALVPTQPVSPADLAWVLGLGKPDRSVPSGAAQLLCYDTAGIRFAQEGKTVGLVSLTMAQPTVTAAGGGAPASPAATPAVDALTRGRELIKQNKYAEAIESFKTTLQSSPRESHQGLGICYYHLRDYRAAEKNIEEAYKRNKKDPVSVFYLAATRDVLQKASNALFYYKAYLRLRHSDESMNAFARSRAAALEGSSPKPSETLRQLLDTIFKQPQP